MEAALAALLPDAEDDAGGAGCPAGGELKGLVARLTVIVVWAARAEVRNRAAIKAFMARWYTPMADIQGYFCSPVPGI